VTGTAVAARTSGAGRAGIADRPAALPFGAECEGGHFFFQLPARAMGASWYFATHHQELELLTAGIAYVIKQRHIIPSYRSLFESEQLNTENVSMKIKRIIQIS
jgi:hypothetical protein